MIESKLDLTNITESELDLTNTTESELVDLT